MATFEVTIEGSLDLAAAALFEVKGLDLPAGSVLDVAATGTYRVGADDVTPKGGGFNLASLEWDPFRKGPHGAGVVIVGEAGRLANQFVAPCVRFVVDTPGRVVIGVNYRGRRSGKIYFQVLPRFASGEEWRTGRASGQCVVPDGPAASSLH